MTMIIRWLRRGLLPGLILIASTPAFAAARHEDSLAWTGLGAKGSLPWGIVVLLTLLTLIPALLLCMTPFVRLLVIFHFLRQALGTQTTPTNQTLIGLALILTWFLMQPVGVAIYQQAIVPYQDGKIGPFEAVDRGSDPVRHFMLRYAREKDLALFIDLAHEPTPPNPEALPMRIVAPAYIISELKAGFQIGAALFLPFLVIDMVVAAITTSVGISRQVPVLVETDPTYTGNVQVGSGVELTGFQSIRDDVLELRVQEEQQQQGQLGSTLDAMQQVETLFPSDGTGLDQEMSQFFNSLSSLSVDPANVSLRQSVLTAARNLANVFQVTSGKLQKQQADLDTQVTQAVSQVNQLTSQIAELNGKISAVPGDSAEAGTFTDQRNELVQQLANIIDVTSIRSDNSISLTTANGASLVVGNQNYQLSTQPDSSGRIQVISGAQNMTSEIHSGQLAGLIHVRDTTIPGVLSDLDTLAYNLATQFNSVHSAGYDLDGNKGADFFVQPAAQAGAAGSLAVNITNPSLIAASSDASNGGNGNLLSLIDLRTNPLSVVPRRSLSIATSYSV